MRHSSRLSSHPITQHVFIFDMMGFSFRVRAALLHLSSFFKSLFTVKKRLAIIPSPAGMSLTNSPCTRPRIIKLISPRESLVSDIPTGDGKIVNLFYSVVSFPIFAILFLRYVFLRSGKRLYNVYQAWSTV